MFFSFRVFILFLSPPFNSADVYSRLFNSSSFLLYVSPPFKGLANTTSAPVHLSSVADYPRRFLVLLGAASSSSLALPFKSKNSPCRYLLFPMFAERRRCRTDGSIGSIDPSWRLCNLIARRGRGLTALREIKRPPPLWLAGALTINSAGN